MNHEWKKNSLPEPERELKATNKSITTTPKKAKNAPPNIPFSCHCCSVQTALFNGSNGVYSCSPRILTIRGPCSGMRSSLYNPRPSSNTFIRSFGSLNSEFSNSVVNSGLESSRRNASARLLGSPSRLHGLCTINTIISATITATTASPPCNARAQIR